MAHVDNLRRHFPVLRNTVFLDTGSFGAIPDAAVSAMQEAMNWELEQGRTADIYEARLASVQREIREQLAWLFHAEPENFMLTDSTTHGLNSVFWGLPLQLADEVILTDVEHEGAILPAFVQRTRRGVVVKSVDGTQPAHLICAAIDQAITVRTRLVVCSHVSRVTGHRLPIEEIVRTAHAKGVLVAVDGAQGAGTEPFDVSASGADFYAFPGHKWLCGPDGVGALYIKKDVHSMLAPTFVGVHSLASADAWNWSGGFLTAADASRFEHNRAGLVRWTGWLESLKFLRITVGWDYAYTRIQGLSGKLLDLLLDFEHVEVTTPRDRRCGLVHFRLEHVDAQAFVRMAGEYAVVLRAVPKRQLVRVSTAFYNTDEDIGRLQRVLTAAKA